MLLNLVIGRLKTASVGFKNEKTLPQNMDHVLGLQSVVRSAVSHLEGLPPGSF